MCTKYSGFVNLASLLEFKKLKISNEINMHVQEDIVASLIDFLVAPHATTTVLLAEKEVWLL